MDIKKQSQTLKKRAKELGYEIKLTHAQEMVASLLGYSSRHSALIDSKKDQKIDKVESNILINQKCQICTTRDRKVVRMMEDSSLYFLCENCSKHPSKFSTENRARDLTDRYSLSRICLRDISWKNNKPSLFEFNLIHQDGSTGDKYLFVPNLPQGNRKIQVWNLTKNQPSEAHWDWEILVKELSDNQDKNNYDKALIGHNLPISVDEEILKQLYEEASGNIIKDNIILDSNGRQVVKYSRELISSFLEETVCDWDCNCDSCRQIKNLIYKD